MNASEHVFKIMVIPTFFFFFLVGGKVWGGGRIRIKEYDKKKE